MKIHPIIPIEVIKEELVGKGVQVAWLEYQNYMNVQTDSLAIKAYSQHKDREVEITILGEKYKLSTLAERIKRVRSAKQQKNQPKQFKKYTKVANKSNVPNKSKSKTNLTFGDFVQPKITSKWVPKKTKTISTSNKFQILETLEDSKQLNESKEELSIVDSTQNKKLENKEIGKIKEKELAKQNTNKLESTQIEKNPKEKEVEERKTKEQQVRQATKRTFSFGRSQVVDSNKMVEKKSTTKDVENVTKVKVLTKEKLENKEIKSITLSKPTEPPDKGNPK